MSGRGRLHSFDFSRGQVACLTNQPPQVAIDQRRSIRHLRPLSLTLLLHGPNAPLNESMFDYANADASMAIGFHLIANNNAFNCSHCSFHWSIEQPHYQTDR
jgi:hypothetical protein